MSKIYEKNKGLFHGIFGDYSGKIDGLVIQKNGRIRVNNQCLIKRKKNHARSN